MFIANLRSAGSGGETELRARIAVVEDEPDLREAVAEYLEANGFEVAAFADAAEMRAAVGEGSFRLAVLDIAMPGEDGLSLGRWLRAESPMGLIFATAAGTSIDRIVGLEIGADDYIVKPYELRELLARVRSVLRRVPPEDSGRRTQAPGARKRRVIAFGAFEADLDARTVRGPGGEVELSRGEFDVLEVFLERPNRLMSRAAIASALGQGDEADSSRALDLRIMRLRRKIEDDPSRPRFLRTSRGEGYVFVPASGPGDAAGTDA